MTYPTYQSFGFIINQIQGELGLPQSTADNTGEQLFSLLKSCGIELCLYYPWQQLNQTYTVTLDGVTTTGYQLPDDWLYFIDQTQWDGTNQWPLLGPINPQEWQWVTKGITTTGPRVRYRVRQDKLFVWPTNVTYTLSMEYISRNWVAGGGYSSGLTLPLPDNTNDYPILDWFMLTKYAKLKFWETKGFDSKTYRNEFLTVFWNLTGKDVGAPILRLSRPNRMQYLGYQNLPDGNWNQ